MIIFNLRVRYSRVKKKGGNMETKFDVKFNGNKSKVRQSGGLIKLH